MKCNNFYDCSYAGGRDAYLVCSIGEHKIYCCGTCGHLYINLDDTQQKYHEENAENLNVSKLQLEMSNKILMWWEGQICQGPRFNEVILKYNAGARTEFAYPLGMILQIAKASETEISQFDQPYTKSRYRITLEKLEDEEVK